MLKYATKIEGCPDCPVMHQEEFRMNLDFGENEVRDAINTAKQIVETKGTGCT